MRRSRSGAGSGLSGLGVGRVGSGSGVVQALRLEDLTSLVRVEFVARYLLEHLYGGVHRGFRHGFSPVFSEHMPYVWGDDVRFIDWKVYARRRRAYVRRYEDETAMRVLLIVDATPSMAYPEGSVAKLRFALYSAGVLLYLLYRQHDPVTVAFVGLDEGWLPPSVRSSHIQRLFHRLNGLLADPQTGTVSTLRGVLERAGGEMPAYTQVVLFSDLSDPIFQEDLDRGKRWWRGWLSALVRRRIALLLFHTLYGPHEEAFGFDEPVVALRDIEVSGHVVVGERTGLGERYRAVLGEWLSFVSSSVRQAGMEYVRVDVSGPFLPVLLEYLRFRQAYM